MSQIPLEAENEFYAAMEREDVEQLEREGFSVIFEGFQPPLHAPVWAQKTA